MFKVMIAYLTRDLWLTDWYKEHQRSSHESKRDSAIYETLKKGLMFSDTLDNPILRETNVDEVRKIIAPTKQSRGYSLVIGEHGTGKTSLIRLAVNSLKEPKGVVYVNIPIDENLTPAVVTNVVRKALGWTSDPVIESRRK
jgi:ABC-type methionine transport system ATPase subunit